MTTITIPRSPAHPDRAMAASKHSRKGLFKTIGLAVWRFLEEVGRRRAARVMKGGHYYV